MVCQDRLLSTEVLTPTMPYLVPLWWTREHCLAGGQYCVLSGGQWWEHCLSSRRLRLEISFQVSRETLSGHRSTVAPVSYIVLNFQGSWVWGTVHAYSLPWVVSHFNPKIRVDGLQPKKCWQRRPLPSWGLLTRGLGKPHSSKAWYYVMQWLRP